jgi:hypothetical protein
MVLVLLIVGFMVIALIVWALFFGAVIGVFALLVDYFRSGMARPPTSRPHLPPQELWQRCDACMGAGGSCVTCGGTGKAPHLT